jgi:hypothetical protein
MRLAEAGPWWDEPVGGHSPAGDAGELAAMEVDLCNAGGLRVVLQRQTHRRKRTPDPGDVLRRARALLGAQLIDTAGEAAC